jgi:hypothetical protein
MTNIDYTNDKYNIYLGKNLCRTSINLFGNTNTEFCCTREIANNSYYYISMDYDIVIPNSDCYIDLISIEIDNNLNFSFQIHGIDSPKDKHFEIASKIYKCMEYGRLEELRSLINEYR